MDNLDSIIAYYKETWTVNENTDVIKAELIDNNVEVFKDSFYCPIWNDEIGGWILLAGTKSKADLWVLKKIIKLIKTKQPVYTMFNGNSDYLFKIFSRYDIRIIDTKDSIVYVGFNLGEV